jgi:hypothetical protein
LQTDVRTVAVRAIPEQRAVDIAGQRVAVDVPPPDLTRQYG